jgi:Tol biopolymer transport system component
VRFRYLATLAAVATVLTATLRVPADAASNGRIAFSRYGRQLRQSQIFTMLPDGSDVTRLTHTRASNGSPAWAADGSRIAFVRLGRDGTGATLMTMDAAGDDRATVFHDGRSIERPDWFADGAHLLFCLRGPARLRLLVVAADGSSLTRIGPKRSCDAALSPDGSKIAFVRFNKVLRHPNVWVMNIDGSGLTPLTSDDHSIAPAWSPDGTRIAFIRHEGWGDNEVSVMDADGSHETQLTASRRVEYGPTAWSPDGALITFQRTTYWDPYSSTDVFAMQPDGSNLTKLTDSPGVWDEGADWQPA